MYRIIWPERKYVTDDQLIVWARDDIANGESAVFADQSEVKTVQDALDVLMDSGTVTIAREE